MSVLPPRSAKLDLAIGLIGLWLAGGFLWDSWAHLHVGVESFFTPYHAAFYAAMLAGAIIVAVTSLRNRARGYTGWALPPCYARALIGIPVFFLGGLGDLVWHTFFGVENRIEAVTSPTHLIIGCGVVLVLAAPIRSALGARDDVRSLGAQLPLLLALAACLEFVHLGTSYAFDASAARIDAPPPALAGSLDYFTATAIELYKTGTGVMIVLLQALIEMIFVVWLVSRFRLAPGALTVFLVLGDGMMAAALTNDRPMLVIHLAMAFVAGVVGDTLIARSRGAMRGGALQAFGFLVPLAYFGTYFALTIALEGTWWNWSLVGGVLVWSALAGAALGTLVGAPGRVDVLAVPVPRRALEPQRLEQTAS